jgi:hypothetical protein
VSALRERLGARLLVWGLRLISDRHAWWFYRQQQDYWTSARGMATLRRIEGGR